MESTPTMFAASRLLVLLIAAGALFAVVLFAAVIVAVARQRSGGASLIAVLLFVLAAIPVVGGWLYLASDARQVKYARPTERHPVEQGRRVVERDSRTIPVREVSSTEEASTRESVVYPTNRPDWVVHPRAFEPGLDQFTISSDPFATRADALNELNERLTESLTAEAVHLKDEAATEIIVASPEHARELLEVDTAAVRTAEVTGSEGHLAGNVFLEKVTFPEPVGEMYQAHARVAINEPFVQFVDSQWRAIESQRRLVGIGSAAGAVVLGLLLLSALLRLGSRASSGRRRLQTGATAAILLLVATL